MEIGIDIVSVLRIENALKKEGFREKVFTKHEIDYCENRKNKYESYAARFAAKEAFVKAMGTGFKNDIGFLDIEIKNEKNGKPYLIYKDKKIKISLSHEKEYAIANIILED